MIGYKATYNGKCLDQLYEVGQTYTLDGELVMCANGFHFCKDLYDVFYYYHPNKNIKVFKIESLGNVETIGDKSVTNKIKILEEVNLSNMILEKQNNKKYFDDKGNLIKDENTSGYWIKYEYNSNNDLIKTEESSGYWVKLEYDSNNNNISLEYSNGSWIKYEYDLNNNRIKFESSDGALYKYEYDDNGKYIKTVVGVGKGQLI